MRYIDLININVFFSLLNLTFSLNDISLHFQINSVCLFTNLHNIVFFFTVFSIVETLSSSALLLTPFINQNRTEEAKQASSVKPDLFLNLTSYSGFFTVDERYGSNTFFWYFPVANKPVDKTPWIIWLQGGPGATSLAGLFDEMGPFEFDTNTLKIIREY